MENVQWRPDTMGEVPPLVEKSDDMDGLPSDQLA
jgi:hypothetical protein